MILVSSVASATLPACSTVPHYFIGAMVAKGQFQSTPTVSPVVSQIHANKAACDKALTEQIGMSGVPGLTGNVIPATTTLFNGVCHATKECTAVAQ